MFDFGLGEILVIAVLVIVFVGPDGLPDMMRVLGRFYGQIRRASDDLRRTFNAEVARVDADRRREELKQRRLAREKARAEELAAAGESPGAESAAVPEDEPEEEPDLLPPDPRLPPDAAPRRVAPRPSPAAAVPRAVGPKAQPTFDPSSGEGADPVAPPGDRPPGGGE